MLSTPKAKEDEGLAQPNNVRTLITQCNVKGVLETKYKLIIHKRDDVGTQESVFARFCDAFFPKLATQVFESKT